MENGHLFRPSIFHRLKSGHTSGSIRMLKHEVVIRKQKPLASRLSRHLQLLREIFFPRKIF